jgi:hypothetical protein
MPPSEDHKLLLHRYDMHVRIRRRASDSEKFSRKNLLGYFISAIVILIGVDLVLGIHTKVITGWC